MSRCQEDLYISSRAKRGSWEINKKKEGDHQGPVDAYEGLLDCAWRFESGKEKTIRGEFNLSRRAEGRKEGYVKKIQRLKGVPRGSACS